MTVAQIPLRGQDRQVRAFALVDSADYEHLSQRRWHLSSGGYASRTVNLGDGRYEAFKMHREILGLRRGDRRQVDHINGDKLDNRRGNLRLVANAENQQNLRSLRATNRSGFRGVYRNCGRWGKPWHASVTVAGRKHFLGTFDTAEEADAAARAFRAEHMPFSPEAALDHEKRGRAVSSADRTTGKRVPMAANCTEPTTVEIAAAEKALAEAFDDGIQIAPDGYYRPVAVAVLEAASKAQLDEFIVAVDRELDSAMDRTLDAALGQGRN
jgi:hypothetical protein